jgi:hypothetical protein
MTAQRSDVRQDAASRMPTMTGAPVCVLVCLAVAVVAGCAGPGSDRYGADAITIERVDSSRAEVTSARVTPRAAEIIVNGRLQKRHYGRSPLPGHLHIAAFDAEGVLLAETTTGYRSLSPKTGLAEFSQSLPVEGERVHRIRVAHYEGHDSDDS